MVFLCFFYGMPNWQIGNEKQNPCLLGAQQGERSRQRQVHGVQTGPMGSKFQRASGL